MASLTARQFPAGFQRQVGVYNTANSGPLNQDVPSSATDLIDKDSFLFQVNFTNGTAGALTVTISDKQATPKHVMEVASIPAATTVAFNWGEGIYCKGGITWSASGAGVDGNVVAFYRP